MNLGDNVTGYTLLWRDTKANISVYRTPNVGAGTLRDLSISSVNNPYLYQRDEY